MCIYVFLYLCISVFLYFFVILYIGYVVRWCCGHIKYCWLRTVEDSCVWYFIVPPNSPVPSANKTKAKIIPANPSFPFYPF